MTSKNTTKAPADRLTDAMRALDILASSWRRGTYQTPNRIIDLASDGDHAAAVLDLVTNGYVLGDVADHVTASGRRALARAHNRAAKFTRARAGEAAPMTCPTPDDTPTYPTVEIAGARVRVWIDRAGTVCVDVNTADAADWLHCDRPDPVPVRVTVDGVTVEDTTDEENADHARPHRFTAHKRPDGVGCRWSHVSAVHPDDRTARRGEVLCPDECPTASVELDEVDHDPDARPAMRTVWTALPYADLDEPPTVVTSEAALLAHMREYAGDHPRAARMLPDLDAARAFAQSEFDLYTEAHRVPVHTRAVWTVTGTAEVWVFTSAADAIADVTRSAIARGLTVPEAPADATAEELNTWASHNTGANIHHHRIA